MDDYVSQPFPVNSYLRRVYSNYRIRNLTADTPYPLLAIEFYWTDKLSGGKLATSRGELEFKSGYVQLPPESNAVINFYSRTICYSL